MRSRENNRIVVAVVAAEVVAVVVEVVVVVVVVADYNYIRFEMLSLQNMYKHHLLKGIYNYLQTRKNYIQELLKLKKTLNV